MNKKRLAGFMDEVLAIIIYPPALMISVVITMFLFIMQKEQFSTA